MLSSGLDVWQTVELLQEYGADLEALTADGPPLDERTLALAHALEKLQTLYPLIAA